MKEFQDILKIRKIFKPSDINNILKYLSQNLETITTNKRVSYYNMPCSFDIETSSFIQNGEKVAIMYEWTFGINGFVIIGRTWQEFIDMLQVISDHLQLNYKNHLIVYVHNLAYEFQFMRKLFTWEKVFAIDKRKPVYAVTTDGIEFRCSYILSGYNLAKLADNLQQFDIHKLTGDLNYSLIRHHKTHLSYDELMYCVNDVKIVMAYIKERIITDGDITRIPLTKTGYVRQYCRNNCFYDPDVPRKKSHKRTRYRELMKSMILSVDEYRQLKRAFQGGFTHANPFYSGQTLKDVYSDDFTSSYPCVMLSEQFPMSSAEEIVISSHEELEKNLHLYCCLFDVEFFNLQSKIYIDNYISSSRCWDISKAVINNGRIVAAEHIRTTVTEQDFLIIRKFYTWDKIRISSFRRYKKDYLPLDFVKSIIQLYKDKTTLKGVAGKEAEYLRSKEMINSCYGMCVTDIVREEITYTNDWSSESPDFEKTIDKYNRSSSRFLFYPWGVWVTAYARRNLFTGIMEFMDDYVYSDTDSIKTVNREKHLDYIKEYNKRILQQLHAAMDYHGLPYSDIEPETIKGIKKPLGVWDYEGRYDKFKTLGAKRYMTMTDDKLSITVSGLNKNICVPYLSEKFGSDVFNAFNDELYVPANFTGKNTHTYIDEIRCGVICDYLGDPADYFEYTSVHLAKADYSLSISAEYANYLRDIKENEVL